MQIDGKGEAVTITKEKGEKSEIILVFPLTFTDWEGFQIKTDFTVHKVTATGRKNKTERLSVSENTPTIHKTESADDHIRKPIPLRPGNGESSKKLWFKVALKGESQKKKQKKKQNYKIHYSLITSKIDDPDTNIPLKHELKYELAPGKLSQGKIIKTGRPVEHWFQFINLVFLFIPLILITIWTLFFNDDVYTQNILTSSRTINLAAGLIMGGLIGTGIGSITSYFNKSMMNFHDFIRYPEIIIRDFKFQKFIEKPKTIFLTGAFFAICALLVYFLWSVPLPELEHKTFAYYDTTDKPEKKEITHSRVYRTDIPNIKIGFKREPTKRDIPFCFANLKTREGLIKSKFPFKRDLKRDYIEYTIRQKLMMDEIKFTFREFIKDTDNGQTQSSIIKKKKLVYDWAREKNNKVIFDRGKNLFFIFHKRPLERLAITSPLTDIYAQIKLSPDYMKIALTADDTYIKEYKMNFDPSSQTVTGENLIKVFNEYFEQMGKINPQKDFKYLTLMGCPFYCFNGSEITLKGEAIKTITQAFESYYKDGVLNVDKRITRVFLRLLLNIEKYFTNKSPLIHESIARVFHKSGGLVYLMYLEECIRFDVLFSLKENSGDTFLRISYFTGKRETLNNRDEFKTMQAMAEGNAFDSRTKAFLKVTMALPTATASMTPLTN